MLTFYPMNIYLTNYIIFQFYQIIIKNIYLFIYFICYKKIIYILVIISIINIMV
jgi:hypothetical protein